MNTFIYNKNNIYASVFYKNTVDGGTWPFAFDRAIYFRYETSKTLVKTLDPLGVLGSSGLIFHPGDKL